jgi:CRISPR-associated protein Cas5t
MEVIRFRVKGFLNSFRIPFFKTYHKSFLLPPKTTIIGMLCNISLKSQKEFFEILDNNSIQVSTVLKSFEGKGKDLWSYRLYEKKNNGKSVIRRDKLYNVEYIVYLNISDTNLYNEVYENLKEPKNIPSLGLDDELVTILPNEVNEITLSDNKDGFIHSSFLTQNPLLQSVSVVEEQKHIEMPTFYNIPTKFEAFDKKGQRKSKEVKEEFLQVEFYNCQVNVNNLNSFYDEEYEYGVIFN